ncbi:MAG: glutamate--tRNA ligase [Candidatus Thorarchaeota archaeon]
MDNLENEVRKFVLDNAVKYEGKPTVKSVMSAIMGTRADLRPRARDIKEIAQRLVLEVEKMPIEKQRAELMEIAPEMLKATPEIVEEKELLDLPNVDKWPKVVMRLAPFPSGPLHIGNARMVILNDYYVKRYKGELILVFDDTIGSAEKVVEPAAFDLIPEGLEYLNVKWHRTVYKSDRLEIFYKYAVDLINRNEAYVCDCNADVWRKEHKVKGKACSCSLLGTEENIARWEKMLDGTYPERGAAVRLRTGMTDPDPAMRDHVILRISETEHHRVGTKYRVWPLLEYSWGIDDHELGVTHIIRGKDLVKEGKIEQHIWNIYDWQHPELIYFGRLKFQDATLSKSKSRREVLDGVYTGWDDPRTWSLQSVEKRGIHPDAIRKVLLDLGLSITDISISMKAIYAENRKLRDADAPRVFFVRSPVWLNLNGIPEDIQEAEAPVHPDFPDRGNRVIPLARLKPDASVKIGISDRDFNRMSEGDIFRLKDMANFTLKKGKKSLGEFHSTNVDDVRQVGGPIIHWIPEQGAVPVELTMVDGELVTGLGEPGIQHMDAGTFLQFERVGFARVFESGDEVKAAFSHK